MHGSGLGFDAEACDGCGLCVAACPTEAITLPAPALLIRADAPRGWLMACAQAAVECRGALAASRIPCLYTLPPGWLWRQVDTQGLASITVATGDCVQCPHSGAAAEWQRQWAAVASVRSAPTLQMAAPRAWQMLAKSAGQSAPARRAFFRRLTTPPGRTATNSTPLSSSRRWLTERLANTSAPALWPVHLDETRCTACLDCTRLCPAQALRMEAAGARDGGDQFTIDAARCIGCGLCVAVCDADALNFAQSPPTGPTAVRTDAPRRVRLQRQICPACGASFYRLQRPDAPPQAARLCRICQRGLPQPRDRIVQTESPPPMPPRQTRP
jgi:ferredoxin